MTSDSGSGDMVVGLVPAAGLGRRIAPAPCSKEILPIGFLRDEDARTGHGAQAVDSGPSGDLPMGAVIAGALDTGLRVYGLPFPHDTFIDIGTPGRLTEALRSASVVDIHQNRGTCDDDLLRQSHERRRTASSLVQR